MMVKDQKVCFHMWTLQFIGGWVPNMRDPKDQISSDEERSQGSEDRKRGDEINCSFFLVFWRCWTLLSLTDCRRFKDAIGHPLWENGQKVCWKAVCFAQKWMDLTHRAAFLNPVFTLDTTHSPEDPLLSGLTCVHLGPIQRVLRSFWEI